MTTKKSSFRGAAALRGLRRFLVEGGETILNNRVNLSVEPRRVVVNPVDLAHTGQSLLLPIGTVSLCLVPLPRQRGHVLEEGEVCLGEGLGIAERWVPIVLTLRQRLIHRRDHPP